MSTKRTTVSMPEIVYEVAKQQMQRYGYTEFSDYIQALIRADTGMQPGTNYLRDASSSPGQQAAAEIAAAAVAEAKQGPLPAPKSTYKIPRRTKKPTPPKPSST